MLDASKLKPGATLGLEPADGTRIVKGELPIFPTWKLCGLSALCEPTTVLAKFKAAVIPILTLRIR